MIIKLMLIFLLIVLLLMFIQYNILIKLEFNIKQSKSGIDVYLQQRFDLIPNLENIVKGYISYEKKIFDNIAKLREQYTQTKNIKISQNLNNQIYNLILVTENYPELKASKQFLELQKNLAKTESQLQAARRIYNNDVTKYNALINTIPTKFVATIFGFHEKDLFQINENTKKNI